MDFMWILRLAPQNDVFFHLAILSLSVILNLFQDPFEMLRLSWIIRGAGGVTSDPHLTGSALLHPTENPQVQHDKMACSGLTISSLSPQGRGGFSCHSEGFDRRIVLDL